MASLEPPAIGGERSIESDAIERKQANQDFVNGDRFGVRAPGPLAHRHGHTSLGQ
jgi:hypothetical protein